MSSRSFGMKTSLPPRLVSRAHITEEPCYLKSTAPCDRFSIEEGGPLAPPHRSFSDVLGERERDRLHWTQGYELAGHVLSSPASSRWLSTAWYTGPSKSYRRNAVVY